MYIATNSLPSVEVINQIRADEAKYRADQLWNITNTDVALSEAPISALNAANAGIQSGFHRYQSMISNAEDAHLLSTAQSQWDAYLKESAKLNLAASNTTEKPIVALANTSATTFNNLTPTLDAWKQFNDRLAASNTASNASTYSSAQTLGIALLLLAVGAGLAIAFVVSRTIKRGTDQMLAAAEGISHGDVDQHMSLRLRRPRLGRLPADGVDF